MLCWPFRLPFSALSRFPGGTLRSEILSAICSCLSLRRATLSIFTNRLTLYPFDRASVSTHLKDTIIVRIIMYRVINVKRYHLLYPVGDSFYCQQHFATTLSQFPFGKCCRHALCEPREAKTPPVIQSGGVSRHALCRPSPPVRHSRRWGYSHRRQCFPGDGVIPIADSVSRA